MEGNSSVLSFTRSRIFSMQRVLPLKSVQFFVYGVHEKGEFDFMLLYFADCLSVYEESLQSAV